MDLNDQMTAKKQEQLRAQTQTLRGRLRHLGCQVKVHIKNCQSNDKAADASSLKFRVRFANRSSQSALTRSQVINNYINQAKINIFDLFKS